MAIKTAVICDFCEQPLPVDIVYATEKRVNNVHLHVTKEWDTRHLFPHLCEGCAGKLDVALAACKNGMTKKTLLADQFSKLNDERREKLGTNG